MLHPLYALRPAGHSAEYDVRLANQALRGFLEELPEGEQAYYECVRSAYGQLYSKSLRATDARYFLDKTPRYYLIIPELARVFPRARFLLLLRNPLAVLVSVLRTWVRDTPHLLAHFKHDLLDAPRRLAEALDGPTQHLTVVHYERMVSGPMETVSHICRTLELEFFPQMIEYGQAGTRKWRFGDQAMVYENDRPLARNKDAWKDALGDPQRWRFARDYLERLGADTLSRLGYDHSELKRVLDDRRPRQKCLDATIDLESGTLARAPVRGSEQLRQRLQQAEDTVDRLRQTLDQLRRSKTYRRLRWGFPRLRWLDKAVRSALEGP